MNDNLNEEDPLLPALRGMQRQLQTILERLPEGSAREAALLSGEDQKGLRTALLALPDLCLEMKKTNLYQKDLSASGTLSVENASLRKRLSENAASALAADVRKISAVADAMGDRPIDRRRAYSVNWPFAVVGGLMFLLGVYFCFRYSGASDRLLEAQRMEARLKEAYPNPKMEEWAADYLLYLKNNHRDLNDKYVKAHPLPEE